MAKFADNLPLHRQSVIYARESAELERALLANWIGVACALLRPLIEAIRRHVLAGAKLHADDTPIPVLAPGNGKTKTARLWTYVMVLRVNALAQVNAEDARHTRRSVDRASRMTTLISKRLIDNAI